MAATSNPETGTPNLTDGLAIATLGRRFYSGFIKEAQKLRAAALLPLLCAAVKHTSGPAVLSWLYIHT